MPIDPSVYPDLESPPSVLDTPEARADYVHRVCAAWDHGVPPDAGTFDLFRSWKSDFDRFPCLTSPAYHATRAWLGWEPLEFPERLPARTPAWVHLDRLEGREADPCEHRI